MLLNLETLYEFLNKNRLFRNKRIDWMSSFHFDEVASSDLFGYSEIKPGFIVKVSNDDSSSEYIIIRIDGSVVIMISIEGGTTKYAIEFINGKWVVVGDENGDYEINVYGYIDEMTRIEDNVFRNTYLGELLGFYAFYPERTESDYDDIIYIIKTWRLNHPITEYINEDNDLLMSTNLLKNRNSILNLAIKSGDIRILNILMDNLRRDDGTYIEEALKFQSSEGKASLMMICVMFWGVDEMKIILERLIESKQHSLAKEIMLLNTKTGVNAFYSLKDRYQKLKLAPRGKVPGVEDKATVAFTSIKDTDIFKGSEEGHKSVLNSKHDRLTIGLWLSGFRMKGVFDLLKQIDLDIDSV